MTESSSAPALVAIHHFSATVTDVEASAAWYQQVLGLQRLPMTFPHYGSPDSGFAVLLRHPTAGFMIGLHHHAANQKEMADETRTGLDHLAFSVPSRADLNAWASWLDRQGVPHAGVTDVTDPVAYSVLVFRDPDNIQLELFWTAS